MRWLFYNLILFFLTGAILIIQLFINTFLPWPFSTLNILLVFLLGFLLVQGANRRSWILAILLGLGLELLTSLPRGLLLISWLATITLVFWLARRFLTNHSLYIVLLLSAIALGVFLGLQFLAQFIFAYRARGTAIPIHANEIVAALWSFVITVVFSGFIFIAARTLIKRFNPAYIRAKR